MIRSPLFFCKYVGGLIGIVNPTKDGLMSKNYANIRLVNNLATNQYRLFKLVSGRYDMFELIANTDDGRFGIYNVSQSGYNNNPFKCSVIKKHNTFNGEIKFFRKDGSLDIYIQLYTKSNATSLWIRKLVDYTGEAIQIEESCESIGNLIEVAVG